MRFLLEGRFFIDWIVCFCVFFFFVFLVFGSDLGCVCFEKCGIVSFCSKECEVI